MGSNHPHPLGHHDRDQGSHLIHTEQYLQDLDECRGPHEKVLGKL